MVAKYCRHLMTDPLRTIREWQNYRLTWLIMLVTAVFLESAAWYFQYVMLMDPCEMCVYQRLAVLVLACAAFIMLLAPKNNIVRGTGYLVWMCGALYGLQAALRQLGYYGDNDLYMTCKIIPDFPFGLPLYDWWPGMFLPSGFCGQDDWLFLGLNMAFWMSITFTVYIVAWGLCIISLFKKNKQ